MSARVCCVIAIAVAGLAALALPAWAGSFSVSPLRAELGEKAKSASFTVVNASSAPLGFQVTARKWTQDSSGNDVYEDSKDLVVFPKQLELPPNGKRIVRVGIEGAPPATEAAYRVFIEELPPAASGSGGRKGTVSVVGRFALPVFVKPASAKGKVVIESASAKDGSYTVRLTNAGNSRVHLTQVAAGGAKDTGVELSNPYLLAGAARDFSGPLGAHCKPGEKVRLTVTSEVAPKAEKELVLPPDACRG
jgi:fimbrial chaperone protein